MTLKISQPTTQSGIKVLILTMDTHLNSAVKRGMETLKRVAPLVSLKIYAATEYTNDEKVLIKCKEDIAQADIIFVGMLFLENQFLPIIEDLKARRDGCDALVCAISAAEVVRLTKIGRFDMSKPASGQNKIGLSQFRKLHLALVHGLNHKQFTQSVMGNLPFFKKPRYDASDRSAIFHDGVSDAAHQTYPASTKDQPDTSLCKFLSKICCGSKIFSGSEIA